jgi:hypothetical protein
MPAAERGRWSRWMDVLWIGFFFFAMVVALRFVSVKFVAFCGVLWLFVANRMRWVVPGKLKFFVKSFGRDHLIVSNGKTGKCHFVAPTFINLPHRPPPFPRDILRN